MIIDRYLGRTLVATSLLALFVLVAIFSFFALIDQLDDTDIGNYGVYEAIKYVVLTMPRQSFELLPIATVVGSMAALGMLANSSELTVIRTSGFSKIQLSLSMFKTGLLFVMVSLVIGEFIAPVTEKWAQELRSIAKTQQLSLQTKDGFWSRDGNNFINIKTVLPGDRLENITIFEFDDEKVLRSKIIAEDADYAEDKWILNNIVRTEITDSRIITTKYERAEWQVLLNPEVISMVTVKPQHLSLYGLVSYIRYLRANNQRSELYEQAFWSKLVNPFAIFAMMLLAICIVRCEGRNVGLGLRVFIGSMIGILFHLFNQVSGHIGIVYGIPAMISVSVPTVAVFIYVYFSLRSQQ